MSMSDFEKRRFVSAYEKRMAESIQVIAALRMHVTQQTIDITREYLDSFHIESRESDIVIRVVSEEEGQNIGVYIHVEGSSAYQGTDMHSSSCPPYCSHRGGRLIMNRSDKHESAQITRLLRKCKTYLDHALNELLCSAEGLHVISSWGVNEVSKLLMNDELRYPTEIWQHVSSFLGERWLDI